MHDNGAMNTYSSSNELLGAGGDAWYVNVGTSSHAAFERLEAADAWFSEPQSGSAAMQLMDLDGDNKADVFHTNFTFQVQQLSICYHLCIEVHDHDRTVLCVSCGRTGPIHCQGPVYFILCQQRLHHSALLLHT